MKIKLLSSMNMVSADSWNALVVDNNPFCRHEFLKALEDNQCIGDKFGWIPKHLAVFHEEDLVGALILFEKHNNYGEFVFDHQWQNAFHNHNLSYYPKLVSSIPYTPASGQRFLFKEEYKEEVLEILFDGVRNLCNDSQCSSFHCLFAESDQLNWLKQKKLSIRQDCQFHWFNHNYTNFDDFLDQLKPKKRKNIRQERKKIQNSDVEIFALDGFTAKDQDWEDFAKFYERIFLEKSGIPTLNADFFKQIASSIPDQVLLFLAKENNESIAGSLMFKSDTKLFGRLWGCIEHIDFLHFELCYYQGIEYCIQNQIKVFEPGAQGEHKVARGFIPQRTFSAHWINALEFRKPIDQFCNDELPYIENYINSVKEHSPFKQS